MLALAAPHAGAAPEVLFDSVVSERRVGDGQRVRRCRSVMSQQDGERTHAVLGRRHVPVGRLRQLLEERCETSDAPVSAGVRRSAVFAG